MSGRTAWRLPLWLLLVWFALCAPLAWAQPVELPAYTPNVVDPAGVLDAADTQRVNDALQRLRDSRQVWGAVYIVPSLQDESIEALSLRAFEKWQLGRKGVDNGLLLVLAMEERRSRFEVGYGLEGSLPDIVAKHALDAYVAPRMREGDIAGAAIDAFDFMGRVVAEDPAAKEELASAGQSDAPEWIRGAVACGGFVVLIWLLPVLYRRRQRRLRDALIRRHPGLADRHEAVATKEPVGRGRRVLLRVLLQAFLTVNPGIFVQFFSAHFLLGFVICMIVELLVFVLVLRHAGRRYRSAEAYRAFLDEVEAQRATLIGEGLVVETESGGYAYTPAYYASQRASSSFGSSSRSSSSGGGRSGGGGASSGW